MKRNSEDISPTRVGQEDTQRRVSGQNSTVRKDRGKLPQCELSGSTTPTKASPAHEVHATQSKERVSTFIEASHYKNVRIPSAEEFPSQPRGMHSYATEDVAQEVLVPSTAGREASWQRVARQPSQTETAHDSLSRICAEGTRTYTPEHLQAVRRLDEPAVPNEIVASNSGPSVHCSPHSMDESADVVMSQSVLLSKEKVKGEVTNASSAKAGPSNNDTPTLFSKPAAGSDSTKMNEGKGKAATFNKFRGAGFASGSSTMRAPEGDGTAMKHRLLRRGSPPFYVTDSESGPAISRATGKQDGGEAGSDILKDSTST